MNHWFPGAHIRPHSDEQEIGDVRIGRQMNPNQRRPLLQGLNQHLGFRNLDFALGRQLAVHVDGHDLGVVGLHVEGDPGGFEEGAAKLVPGGDGECLGGADGELGGVPRESVISNRQLGWGETEGLRSLQLGRLKEWATEVLVGSDCESPGGPRKAQRSPGKVSFRLSTGKIKNLKEGTIRKQEFAEACYEDDSKKGLPQPSQRVKCECLGGALIESSA